MDITDEVEVEVIKDVQETEVSKKPVKVKIDYDGYYLVDTIDRDGNKTSIPARGYNLKSWLNFEKSLTMNVSVDYRQVVESEYMKYHWTSFDMPDVVVEIESAGDGNRQPVLSKRPKKPVFPKKAKMDEHKVAKTDRNIGDITTFME